MNSHNTKPAFSTHKTPVADDSAVEEARVIGAKLIRDVDLTVDDSDPDQGCDPYNTTGQHVILQQKRSNRD